VLPGHIPRLPGPVSRQARV